MPELQRQIVRKENNPAVVQLETFTQPGRAGINVEIQPWDIRLTRSLERKIVRVVPVAIINEHNAGHPTEWFVWFAIRRRN